MINTVLHKPFRTALLLSFLAGGASMAATSEAIEMPYPKVVIDQDVRNTFQDFGRDLGYMMVVDPRINGTVRQPNSELSGREFLDDIALSVSATWYENNGVIYVEPLEDISQRVFDISDVDRSKLYATLASLDFDLDAFPIRFSDDDKIVVVSGPLDFLSNVSDVIILEGGRSLTDLNQADTELVTEVSDDPLPSVFRGRVAQ